MFGKLYNAKVGKQSMAGKKMRGSDQVQVLCGVDLIYDFTPDLAAAIGGNAPAIQEMLAQDGEQAVKVAKAGLTLDCRDVAVLMKSSIQGSDPLKVARTTTFSARVAQPTKDATSPKLVAALQFNLDPEDHYPVAFLHENMAKMCKVRLDKRQLELPATSAEEEE